MPDKHELNEIEELEELICEDIELGISPQRAVKERCDEAMRNADNRQTDE